MLPVIVSFLAVLFSIPLWIKRAKRVGLTGKDQHKTDKKELAEAKDPEEKAKLLEEEYIDTFANPTMAASMGYVDDIINPEDTRAILIQYLESLLSKSVKRPERKHGNIPL